MSIQDAEQRITNEGHAGAASVEAQEALNRPSALF